MLGHSFVSEHQCSLVRRIWVSLQDCVFPTKKDALVKPIMIIVISGGSVRLFGVPMSCDIDTANVIRYCIKNNTMISSVLPKSYYSHIDQLATPLSHHFLPRALALPRAPPLPFAPPVRAVGLLRPAL